MEKKTRLSRQKKLDKGGHVACSNFKDWSFSTLLPQRLPLVCSACFGCFEAERQNLSLSNPSPSPFKPIGEPPCQNFSTTARRRTSESQVWCSLAQHSLKNRGLFPDKAERLWPSSLNKLFNYHLQASKKKKKKKWILAVVQANGWQAAMFRSSGPNLAVRSLWTVNLPAANAEALGKSRHLPHVGSRLERRGNSRAGLGLSNELHARAAFRTFPLKFNNLDANSDAAHASLNSACCGVFREDWEEIFKNEGHFLFILYSKEQFCWIF